MQHLAINATRQQRWHSPCAQMCRFLSPALCLTSSQYDRYCIRNPSGCRYPPIFPDLACTISTYRLPPPLPLFGHRGPHFVPPFILWASSEDTLLYIPLSEFFFSDSHSSSWSTCIYKTRLGIRVVQYNNPHFPLKYLTCILFFPSFLNPALIFT